MNPHYPRVARRAGCRCEYCRAPEAIFNLPFEVEHVLPVSRGGRHDESNLALACRACNIYKADRVTGLDESTGTDFPLFDPRRDRWEDHFEAEAETGTIHGKTAIGRATVARLQLNAPLSTAARKQWSRLGLFP